MSLFLNVPVLFLDSQPYLLYYELKRTFKINTFLFQVKVTKVTLCIGHTVQTCQEARLYFVQSIWQSSRILKCEMCVCGECMYVCIIVSFTPIPRWRNYLNNNL